jgi:hypothetical protein
VRFRNEKGWLPAALRRALGGRRDRQAPTWRRTAREASDVRTLGEALTRLAEAPAGLIRGPEPPPLPAAGGRLGWLRRYRPLLLWLAAAATFALGVQLLVENSRLLEPLVPVVAACIALPLVLAVDTPLRA